jgi:hypothetical protein
MFPEFVSQFVANAFVVPRKPGLKRPPSSDGVEGFETAQKPPLDQPDSLHRWINIALAAVIGVFGVLILLRG